MPTAVLRACPSADCVSVNVNDSVADIRPTVQFRQHLHLFIDTYNHGRRLKTLRAASRRTNTTLELRAENVADAQTITRNQAGSLDLGVPRTLWLALILR